MSEVSARRKPGPQPLHPSLVRAVGVKAMLTTNEAEGLRAVAAEAGMSMSDYIRRLVQDQFSRYVRGGEA